MAERKPLSLEECEKRLIDFLEKLPDCDVGCSGKSWSFLPNIFTEMEVTIHPSCSQFMSVKMICVGCGLVRTFSMHSLIAKLQMNVNELRALFAIFERRATMMHKQSLRSKQAKQQLDKAKKDGQVN